MVTLSLRNVSAQVNDSSAARSKRICRSMGFYVFDKDFVVRKSHNSCHTYLPLTSF